MKRRARNRPYGLLARFYDELVPGVAAMNRHAREKILRSVLPRIRSVCELACGNGATALDLAKRGLEVQAIDFSPAFVRIVRERARQTDVTIDVRRGDMREFRLAAPVDLVLCEFAALNNLDEHRDLGRVVRCAARATKPGGWFLFDVNTPLSFETQIATFWHEGPGFKLALHGESLDRGRRARLEFEWFLPVAATRAVARRADARARSGHGSRMQHSREVIGHVAWSEKEIRRELRSAGFGDVRVFDGVDVRPRMKGARRGTDLYFLARRSRD